MKKEIYFLMIAKEPILLFSYGGLMQAIMFRATNLVLIWIWVRVRATNAIWVMPMHPKIIKNHLSEKNKDECLFTFISQLKETN